MNILSTQYTLSNKSFEIYVAGCSANPHCTGCHNPETWNFNQGTPYNKDQFNSWKEKIKTFNNLVINIMIFGGEPLDQDIDDLVYMLKDLNILDKKIWLFTRYSFNEAKEKLKDKINLLDYIKCGKYLPELTVDNNIQYGITLATSNQKIYKIDKE